MSLGYLLATSASASSKKVVVKKSISPHRSDEKNKLGNRSKQTTARVHRSQRKQQQTQTSSKDLLKKLANHLRGVVGRMEKWGFKLDESYCHVGAAYTTAYLASINVDAHLFQPLPFHMLAYFDYRGKRYYIDQSMAQFFKKKSPPHKRLLKSGGFFGTSQDFYQFYYKYADDVKEWDNYQDGGFLSKDSKPSKEGVVPYEMWESTINWKKLHSREQRARRIVHSWYKDFRTDTSHNQTTGLYWTAKYFYNIFQVKLALPYPPYNIP